jgi:hypothetical protein
MIRALKPSWRFSGALLASLLGGCVQETPKYGPIAPEAASAILPFLRDGITTRAECLARLGDPSFAYDNDTTLVYLSENGFHAGVPLPLSQTPWSSAWPTASLVLAFDEHAVLRRHEIVERPRD